MIDLFSDTMTRPTPAMRQAMAEAEVGDEQRGEDPTTNRLQERVADLLGKEAAVFLPSGAMCNQVSFAVHCRAGDEILMDRTAHPLNYEAGGPTALVGALIRPLDGRRGIYTADQVRAALRPGHRQSPVSRAISVEQTTNLGGGACWSRAEVDAVVAAARAAGLATHMDGARLLNAVVATGTPAADFAAGFDSVWIDLSKGLGAPVGAVLAGSREFIQAAWLWKQRLGGAMRQTGILAAAGLYALDHHVDRLADDHANARRFAEGIADVPGISLDPEEVGTNIVVFSVRGDAGAFVRRLLEEHGVRVTVVSNGMVRAVTHLDVDQQGIDQAIAGVRMLLGTRV